jgi:tRNA 2-thiouridine synthesizing protein A
VAVLAPSKYVTLLFIRRTIMSDTKVVADDVQVTSVLDAKGLSCPMPLLRTKKEMGKMASGDVLQVDGTDPGSRNDIPGWCDRSGHEYLGEKEGSGFISFYIKKG